MPPQFARFGAAPLLHSAHTAVALAFAILVIGLIWLCAWRAHGLAAALDACARLEREAQASLGREAKLRLSLEAQDDMFDRLPMAAAVFNSERRLIRYNAAYAKLWGFARVWLDGRPGYGEILESLRDRRKLPEQRNFSQWKRSQIQDFATPASAPQETWHLPGGQSLRIAIQPHLEGGVFVLYEDVSENLLLEASLNLLGQVQKATLDSLDDGIAIFGTDGRLVLHNALFTKMWQLHEEELVDHPHFSRIAAWCGTRIGHDGLWTIVSSGINAANPEHLRGRIKAIRQDGRLISLSMTRLPNGATAVAFSDETDLERFGSEAKDSHAAA